jgi:hypothetical protein
MCDTRIMPSSIVATAARSAARKKLCANRSAIGWHTFRPLLRGVGEIGIERIRQANLAARKLVKSRFAKAEDAR